MPARPAAVAGRFYPAAPDSLRNVVQHHLDGAIVTPNPTGVTALIAPHAGYPYSGPTAAHVFRRIQGMAPGRIVLMGPSHHFRFRGLSIDTGGDWATPLGNVPLDNDFAARLAERFGNHCPDAHVPEHALEVELPFLQSVLSPGFLIVPILFGDEAGMLHRRLAETLVEWLEPGDLLVASTDLSHFLPELAANEIDRHSLEVVLSGDPEVLREGLRDQTCSLCGGTAVYTALAAANCAGATTRTLWDYRTSGASTGDFSRVVGYGAVSLEHPA